MRLRRKPRILTAFLVVVGLLFAQLALAAYTCQIDRSKPTSEPTMTSMPGCEESEPAALPLCKAHCEDAKASLDKPPPATASAPALPFVFAVLTLSEPPAEPQLAAFGQSTLLRRITSPPIAIRNCCFRI